MPGRRRYRDRHDPARDSGRAHRAARRGADGRDQPVLEDGAIRSRRRCSSSSTAIARSRHAAGRDGARHRRRARRPPLRMGDATRGSRAALAGAAQRALCGAGAAAWLPLVDDRRLRADFPRSPTALSRPSATTRSASFPVCLVGHAGDGNFHLMYLAGSRRSQGSGRGATAQRTARRARAGVRWHVHRRARRRDSARSNT